MAGLAGVVVAGASQSARPLAGAAGTSPTPSTDPAGLQTAPTPSTPAPTASVSSTGAASSIADAPALSDPDSISVIVNKHRPLNPSAYRPADLIQPAVTLATQGESALLRAPAAAALESLAQAAAQAGAPFRLLSGFRSYETQQSTYNALTASEGVPSADHASARPGYSEHQTGLAADLSDPAGCDLAACYGQTPSGAWVAQNCYRFGFLVRYQANHQQVTGYLAEPWHVRFLGIDLATRVHDSGFSTLEEFFGLEPAPDYR